MFNLHVISTPHVNLGKDVYIRHDKRLLEICFCRVLWQLFALVTYVMPMVQNVSSTMRMVSLEPLMDDSPAKAAMVAGLLPSQPGDKG